MTRRPVLKDKQPLRSTLADYLLKAGVQHLRADETATATTFSLPHAAKWVQATKGGAR